MVYCHWFREVDDLPGCTFFGHRNCPSSIREKLRAVLVELIEERHVDQFYVGRQGAFDSMARSVLRELEECYPHICYSVVLERLPGRRDEAVWDFSDTIFPEGLETVPPRWAISQRNRWMLKHADYVVTYIAHSWGGAAQFAEQALRQKKQVINLAELRD